MNLDSNEKHGKIRVLYIDDERENLIGFKYMFRESYDLSLAQSAAQALALLEQMTFDVIISDQRMSEMTGVEFFEKILPNHPHTARMILTGYSDFDAIVDAINRGKIYYYFKKPWDENEVRIVISNAVEAQRLEDEVRVNERRFHDIAESSGDWIWETDVDWRYTFASGNVRAILGRSPDELLGKTPFDLMPDETALSMAELYNELSSSCQPIRDLELCCLSETGQKVHLLTNGVPIMNGNLRGYRGVDKDISERKRMEEQLRQTEKMNAIGQLASGIAHDFNNQLGGILGHAELLQISIHDSKLQEYVANIITATERSAELTAGLLAFGRKGKAIMVPVDIHLLIEEVILLLERTHKEVVVSKALTAEQTIVTGDPSQLQNAFLNMAINAKDATINGGEIFFESKLVALNEEFCGSCGESIAPGTYLFVRIVDTGCGIDQESKEHIFEPFYTTKEGGTGLGLASVLGCVLDHGGTIDLKSKLGSGTELGVFLPLAMKQVRQQADDVESKSVSTKESAHILFADDEEMIRRVSVAALEELGHSTTVCVNGKEALEYYRESWQDVDLVILDVNMPVLNGVEAYMAMREINPDIRVIIASGFSDDALFAITDASVIFLNKPYRMSELADRIDQALNARLSPNG